VIRDVVEAFAAEGADEAFGNRVRPRCPDRGADDAESAAAKTASNAAVNLLSRSRIKNRNRSARSPRFMNRLLKWDRYGLASKAFHPALIRNRRDRAAKSLQIRMTHGSMARSLAA
jgi:hypothetical protein